MSEVKNVAKPMWFSANLSALIVQVAHQASIEKGADFLNTVRVLNHLLVKKPNSRANSLEARARTVGYLRDLIHAGATAERPGPGNYNPSKFQQLFYKTQAELMAEEEEDGDD